MKKDLKKREDELENLKKTGKNTKINELTIENKELNDELIKLRNFYELSVQQNVQYEQKLQDFSILEDSFNKQQFILITYQDNIKKLEQDMKLRDEELRTIRNNLNDKSQQNSKLKKDIKVYQQKVKDQTTSHVANLISSNKESVKSFAESVSKTNDNKKSELEKKLASYKREVAYYRELCTKKEARIRELESSTKKENNTGYIKFDENPEEHTDTTILLLKSKLHELRNEKEQFEIRNKELEERLKMYENNGFNNSSTSNWDMAKKTNSNTKLSHSYDLLNDDQFNELVYILIKNFEANKIDVHIIESRIFENLNSQDIQQRQFFESLCNNFTTLLKWYTYLNP
jgi:chromosome segregation ATPase